MTDLKETLRDIAMAIVDSPDEVTVVEAVNGKRVKTLSSENHPRAEVQTWLEGMCL